MNKLTQIKSHRGVKTGGRAKVCCWTSCVMTISTSGNTRSKLLGAGCRRRAGGGMPEPERLSGVVEPVVRAIWLTAGQPCGQRLVADSARWLPYYERRHGRLSPPVRRPGGRPRARWMTACPFPCWGLIRTTAGSFSTTICGPICGSAQPRWPSPAHAPSLGRQRACRAEELDVGAPAPWAPGDWPVRPWWNRSARSAGRCGRGYSSPSK
jgi:hypothetical protein